MLALTLAALAVGLGNFGGIGHIGLAGASIATRIKVGAVFGVFEAGLPWLACWQAGSRAGGG